MQLSLPVELEAFVRERAGTERYPTAEAVVSEALTLLRRREAEEAANTQSLRDSLRQAEEAVDRGQYVAAKDLTVERIRHGAVQRLGQPAQRKQA